MGTALIHPLSRRLPRSPEGDELEPIATLANLREPGIPFDPALEQITLALGARGSYRVEVGIRLEADGYRDFELRGVRRHARFAALLHEGLDDAQRGALGLSSERLAALDALEDLLRAIDTGELVRARRQGRECFAALERAFAVEAVAVVGDAALRRPVVRDARTAERLGERALATFLFDPGEALGRLRQVLRVLPDLAGVERDDWERYPDRTRRAAFFAPNPTPREVRESLRELGLETVKLPCALVHPAMLRPIASRLGVTPDELHRRLRGEAEHDDDDEEAILRLGPRSLANELGDPELLTHEIPVVPEEERPMLYFPANDPDAATTELNDPTSEAYASLRGWIERDQRLAELGAPAILIHQNGCSLQRCFEQLLARVRTPLDVTTLDGWGPAGIARAEVHLRCSADAGDDDAIPSAIWLTEDRVLIATAGIARVISLRERRVLREIPIGSSRLQACDDAGRFVLVSADSMFVDDDEIPSGFGCFDASSGTWMDTLPAALPAVTFGKNEPEDGVLYELRRGSAIAVSGDRPTALAYARGNRAVLLSGDYAAAADEGVRSTLTGLVEVSGRALPGSDDATPVLAQDGTLRAPTSADDHARIDEQMSERWGERIYIPHPAAIARAGSWRLLTPSLDVGEARRTWFRLGFAIDAASFSPDAARLLVVHDELTVIDLSTRAITWRARLDELAG